jgi:hypothetical protein
VFSFIFPYQFWSVSMSLSFSPQNFLKTTILPPFQPKEDLKPGPGSAMLKSHLKQDTISFRASISDLRKTYQPQGSPLGDQDYETFYDRGLEHYKALMNQRVFLKQDSPLQKGVSAFTRHYAQFTLKQVAGAEEAAVHSLKQDLIQGGFDWVNAFDELGQSYNSIGENAFGKRFLYD